MLYPVALSIEVGAIGEKVTDGVWAQCELLNSRFPDSFYEALPITT